MSCFGMAVWRAEESAEQNGKASGIDSQLVNEPHLDNVLLFQGRS